MSIIFRNDLLERGDVLGMLELATDLMFARSKSRNEISMDEFIAGLEEITKTAKLSNRKDMI